MKVFISPIRGGFRVVQQGNPKNSREVSSSTDVCKLGEQVGWNPRAHRGTFCTCPLCEIAARTTLEVLGSAEAIEINDENYFKKPQEQE